MEFKVRQRIGDSSGNSRSDSGHCVNQITLSHAGSDNSRAVVAGTTLSGAGLSHAGSTSLSSQRRCSLYHTRVVWFLLTFDLVLQRQEGIGQFAEVVLLYVG